MTEENDTGTTLTTRAPAAIFSQMHEILKSNMIPGKGAVLFCEKTSL